MSVNRLLRELVEKVANALSRHRAQHDFPFGLQPALAGTRIPVPRPPVLLATGSRYPSRVPLPPPPPSSTPVLPNAADFKADLHLKWEEIRKNLGALTDDEAHQALKAIEQKLQHLSNNPTPAPVKTSDELYKNLEDIQENISTLPVDEANQAMKVIHSQLSSRGPAVPAQEEPGSIEGLPRIRVPTIKDHLTSTDGLGVHPLNQPPAAFASSSTPSQTPKGTIPPHEAATTGLLQTDPLQSTQETCPAPTLKDYASKEGELPAMPSSAQAQTSGQTPPSVGDAQWIEQVWTHIQEKDKKPKL